MNIEVVGIQDKSLEGMKTTVTYKLNAEPDRLWLDTFLYSQGIAVTNYRREMFAFEGDTVTVSFMGPRLEECTQTLHLYLADVNKKAEEARRQKASPRERFKMEEEKRRQTEQLSRELFGDDDLPKE